MSEKLPLIEIATLEESLRLTPEERILRNNIVANRWLEIESFMEKLYRGWNYIKSRHGNTR